MTIEAVFAGLAVIVAVASAAYARGSVKQAKRSADAAEAQVAGQREANVGAAQPYVWADIRGNDVSGFLLELVIGNAGPTVAQNVRVRFNPPLVLPGDFEARNEGLFERLENGLRSLAPGATRHWNLGPGTDMVPDSTPQIVHIFIDADGPFGPVERLEYEIDLADLRGSSDRPSGSLHSLTRAVEGVAEQIEMGQKRAPKGLR